jgi:hypothetical protein
MTPEQFEADKNYLAAREIAEGFLKKGLLTPDEFDNTRVYELGDRSLNSMLRGTMSLPNKAA